MAVTVGGITFNNVIRVDPTRGTFYDIYNRNEQEDTLLVFPAGHTIDSGSNRIVVDANKIGLYTENQGKTQIRVNSNLTSYSPTARNTDYFYMRGFNYDHSFGTGNSSGVLTYANIRHVLQDITQIGGVADAPKSVACNSFVGAARSSNAYVLWERCIDESHGTGYHTTGNGGNGRIGMQSHSGYNLGRIHLKNCRVTDVANNAVYMSNQGSTGWVHVQGGIYEHSYGAQVRTGGNGTILEDVYMEVDMVNKSIRDWGGGQPGIRWEVKGDSNDASGTIRNCHIRLISGNPGQSVRLQTSAKDVNVQNVFTEINLPNQQSLDVHGIGDYKFDPPTGYTNYNRIFVDNFNVTGTNASDAPAYIGDGRDGMTVDNSCIPGGFEGPGTATVTNFSQSGCSPTAERPTTLPPVGEDPNIGTGGGTEPPVESGKEMRVSPWTTVPDRYMIAEIRRRNNSP